MRYLTQAQGSTPEELIADAHRPHKGFRFLHSRVLDEHNRPAEFKVTKVSQGTVYYRPERGGVQCCPVEDFPKYCLRPC